MKIKCTESHARLKRVHSLMRTPMEGEDYIHIVGKSISGWGWQWLVW